MGGGVHAAPAQMDGRPKETLAGAIRARPIRSSFACVRNACRSACRDPERPKRDVLGRGAGPLRDGATGILCGVELSANGKRSAGASRSISVLDRKVGALIDAQSGPADRPPEAGTRPGRPSVESGVPAGAK